MTEKGTEKEGDRESEKEREKKRRRQRRKKTGEKECESSPGIIRQSQSATDKGFDQPWTCRVSRWKHAVCLDGLAMLLRSVLTETLNEGWRRFAGPSRVARYDLTPRAE